MTAAARRIALRWPWALALALALVVAGAAAALWWSRPSLAPPPAAATRNPAPPADAAQPSGSEGRVSLTPEMASRAGIAIEPVMTAMESGELRLPGTVQPDAYRQVIVTSLVPGRVTAVSAALGDHVTAGQALAQIFSPALADAQSAFAAKQAEVKAVGAQLERTERLVAIGAASRQELELLGAEHTRHMTELASARARLSLLGVPASRIDHLDHAASISAGSVVAAPIAGVITERSVNVGLNVETTTPLFTVVDLSRVWIEGDVYEADLASVRVGSTVTIATDAYPDLSLQGKVTYIDPAVRPETRTAKVRVEVPNRDGRLKLGMFARIIVRLESARAVLSVPRSALQTVGDLQIVYLEDPRRPGDFIDRAVQVEDSGGERVRIVAGLKAGDRIVTKGTFFLRSERERNGSRSAASSSSAVTPTVQSVQVEVTEMGFEPATVNVKAGMPVRVTFIRRTDKTCATEVVIPSQAVRRALPLNQPVEWEFTPAAAGAIAFACGMDMFKGTIVVR